MSSDSELNSFTNFWSSSDEDVMEDNEVEESSNTQTDVTHRVT